MAVISASDNSMLNDSSSPDPRGVENISLRSLADNISTILATIQSNTEILNYLDTFGPLNLDYHTLRLLLLPPKRKSPN